MVSIRHLKNEYKKFNLDIQEIRVTILTKLIVEIRRTRNSTFEAATPVHMRNRDQIN